MNPSNLLPPLTGNTAHAPPNRFIAPPHRYRLFRLFSFIATSFVQIFEGLALTAGRGLMARTVSRLFLALHFKLATREITGLTKYSNYCMLRRRNLCSLQQFCGSDADIDCEILRRDEVREMYWALEMVKPLARLRGHGGKILSSQPSTEA